MRFAFLPLVLAFISSVNALHFYLDANQKRCFIEELPTDTAVEGVYDALARLNCLLNVLQAISRPWSGRNRRTNMS